MPKIGGDVKSKSRSRRKPLRDVSNGGFRHPPTNSVINKSNPNTRQQQPPATTCGGGGGGSGDPIDRLLLIHSDLSVLIHQIDELIVQAVEQKMNPKEIESFAHVLQDMQTSLKPWVSRFQKVLPTPATRSENQTETSLVCKKITPSINEDTNKIIDSPNVDKFDFLISPSPLVSWRAGCAAEGGRNLFLLTPLPKPTPFISKLKKSSKLVFENITNDVTVDPVTKNLKVFSSPEKPVRRNDSIIVSTPYLKMSPPKSCILLEPASISTKHPTIHHAVDGGDSGDSEPSSIQPSGHLSLKYPELFGIKPAHKLGNARKVVEASPGWGMSPPKSCVFLEPSDDRIKDADNLPKAGGIRSVSRNTVIESTPMCKDLDTTILKGKRAGENTLKKELWMRFEAATAHGVHFKTSVDQKTINDNHTNKGFLDLLEEACCDDIINSNV